VKQRFHLCRVGGLAVFGALFFHLSNLGAEETKSRHMIDNSEVSSSAFEAMMPVLRHPRCMNCHSSGDFPRQGDDSHPHIMDVRRGTDGHGVNGVKCTTCHQDHNLPGVHMPPGAPDWGLPSSTTPMIWEGLNDRELCQLFKDPKRNGHRTVAQIVEHMHTPLVLWGWSPGEGRTPIPYSEKSFLENVKLWAENGAGCPVENSNH
jgi:hypothetical protein